MFRFRERDFDGIEHAEGNDRAVADPLRRSRALVRRGRKRCSACTARRATIRPSRHARRPTRIRRFRTSRSSARAFERMRARGLHPLHMPSAIDFHPGGTCIRCGTCDAFPCQIGAKGDAETRLIDPALKHPNVALADRQPGHAAAHRRTRQAHRCGGVERGGKTADRQRTLVRAVGRRDQQRGDAVALGRLRAIRRAWPTPRAWSAATT